MAGEVAEPTKTDVPATQTPEDALVDRVKTAARDAVLSTFAAAAGAAGAGDAPVRKVASVDFDVASGKWRVAHKNLVQPALFTSKGDAEIFKTALLAEDLPRVAWNEDVKSFTITHASWDKPVTVSSSEEATEVIEKTLEGKGWDESEAKQRAGELTSTARKEKVMASVVEVSAAAKQNPQKAEISGIKDNAGAKQDVKNNTVSGVGGVVVTEEGGIKTLEAGKGGEHSMKQTHDKDYGALANKAEALAKQLKSHQGVMKLCSQLIEEHGVEPVTKALELVASMRKAPTPEQK